MLAEASELIGGQPHERCVLETIGKIKDSNDEASCDAAIVVLAAAAFGECLPNLFSTDILKKGIVNCILRALTTGHFLYKNSKEKLTTARKKFKGRIASNEVLNLAGWLCVYEAWLECWDVKRRTNSVHFVLDALLLDIVVATARCRRGVSTR